MATTGEAEEAKSGENVDARIVARILPPISAMEYRFFYISRGKRFVIYRRCLEHTRV
jgi:hypothetical protein